MFEELEKQSLKKWLIRNNNQLVDDWHRSHSYVLNTFQLLCKRRLSSSGVKAEFAQRLKRKKTVIDKLSRKRPDDSALISDVTKMQNFAGCRLIFETIDDLNRFRKKLIDKPGPVKHKRINPPSKFDYISSPKNSGYRGIHDVFAHYPRPHRRGVEGDKGGYWNGLLVEIQYRTRVQHAWATAVELSDLIDNEKTKFKITEKPEQLDERSRFFALCSEFLARKYENERSAFPDKPDDEVKVEIEELEDKLGILEKLSSMSGVRSDQIGKHNIINRKFNEGGEFDIEVMKFARRTLAMKRLDELEMNMFLNDPFYVGSDDPAQLKSAY